MLLIGGISALQLPIAQYPQVAPPQVQVTTTYTGADALSVARTVTTPIEQQINGTKGMIYYNSDSTSNGVSNIVATFDVGYSQDMAAVDIQNRVQTAHAQRPTGPQRAALRGTDTRQGAAGEGPRVRGDHRPPRRRRLDRPHQGRRPRRAVVRALRVGGLHRRQAGRRHPDLPVRRRQRAEHHPPGPRGDGPPQDALPGRARLHDLLP